MSEYIKTVIITVLSVSVISYLFPKNSFGKFANIIASVIVMTVLLLPALKLGRKESLNLDKLPVQELAQSENDYIKAEFETELSQKLRQELKNKTGKEFFVNITVVVDEETVSIEKTAIFPYTKEYAGIAASYLGIEEDRVVQK